MLNIPPPSKIRPDSIEIDVESMESMQKKIGEQQEEENK